MFPLVYFPFKMCSLANTTQLNHYLWLLYLGGVMLCKLPKENYKMLNRYTIFLYLFCTVLFYRCTKPRLQGEKMV